jgi:hypothetical protein
MSGNHVSNARRAFHNVLRRLSFQSGISMSTVFNVIAVLFMVAVALVLVRGLINMMRGGSGNTSNKLMQARVVLQFLALVFVMLALYFSRQSGG